MSIEFNDTQNPPMLGADYQKIIDIWFIYQRIFVSFEIFCFWSIYYRLFHLVFTKNIFGDSVWKTSLGVLIPLGNGTKEYIYKYICMYVCLQVYLKVMRVKVTKI